MSSSGDESRTTLSRSSPEWEGESDHEVPPRELMRRLTFDMRQRIRKAFSNGRRA